ncbi:L,D-transpeptidase family protein [Chloroflexota bacterium]
MSNSLSRRDFLKLGGLAVGGLAFDRVFPRQSDQDHGLLARIATKQVDVRSRPNDESNIVGNRFRDQMVHIYEELHPPDAPEFYNTLWYRVWGGYLHSAHLQIVKTRLNEPVRYINEGGQLFEVTVPYTTAYQNSVWEGWHPWRGSRLYYSSTHWVTGLEEGPDGRLWYRITSELSKMEHYLVPAEHLRLVPPEDYAPISPNIPADKKRIEVSLKEQTVRAFEYDDRVWSARISSGIPNNRLPEDVLPTATPKGKFRIYAKQPSKHMGGIAGGQEVEDNGGFSLPGVPWTCFFASPGGYAFHGTYWHDNFGLQMSHGCVNMRNEDAKWLFRWTTPMYGHEIEAPSDWELTGFGTVVNIF